MSAAQLRNMLIALACVLLGVGVLMVYSASITARPSSTDEIYLSRHATFLCVAILCGTTAGVMPARFWKRAAPWLFVATTVLLALVLVPGLGHRVNGAQRWFRFGPVSMQPSEFAKLTIPLFLCWILGDRRQGASELHGSSWRNRASKLAVVAPIGLVLGLVQAEPDLGTAAFLAGLAGITLFLARWPLWCFAVTGLAALPLVIGTVFLRPYQLERITGFLATWRDFREAPYQVQQSLTTLGSGGWTGAGLGSGWQKLSFLPESNTDFVFAVVGEELGLVGTLGLLGLWAALYWFGIALLTRKSVPEFESVAGRALLIQLVAQAGVNMAIVTALAPPKGIAHPLVSYGGSSLLTSVIALGMIISLSRSRSSES